MVTAAASAKIPYYFNIKLKVELLYFLFCCTYILANATEVVIQVTEQELTFIKANDLVAMFGCVKYSSNFTVDFFNKYVYAIKL